MKKFALAVVLFVFVAGLAASFPQTGKPPAKAAPGHAITRPEALQWSPFMTDVEIAPVQGDFNKVGEFYAFRVRFKDGAKIPPHWHPTDEHVTVLSGTFRMGMGEKFDPAKTENVTAGGYCFIPKVMRHFAVAKGDTIVQVGGIGPFVFKWVNPEDDPAKKAAPTKR